MASKRLILLTRDDLVHRYVANTLCAALDIKAIIVDCKPEMANWRRAAKRGIAHFASKAARAALLRIIRDDLARDKALRRLLGDRAEAFERPELLKPVEGINSSHAQALVREFSPTAILVFGTTVVRDSTLRLATDVCLNMHTGVSPYYRGTACAFWPVANGELDMLGATIHECTSAIDGGAIYEVVRTAYNPGDDLHTLFGRAVMAGSEAYVRVVQAYLAGKLAGAPQDLGIGREYRGSDLTIGPELRARLLLARLARQSRPGALRSSLLGRCESLARFEHARLQPAGDHLPRGEVADRDE